jgi:hypothetical protein
MNWEEIYRPLVGASLSGLAFMCIGADAVRVVANSLGSPSMWFAGAVHLGFDGHGDHYVTQGENADGGFLTASAALNWLPFSLTDIPVWTGSWSELLGAKLKAVTLYGEDAAHVGAAHYEFLGGSRAMDLWVSIGLEDVDAIGDGDELYVSQAPHHTLKTLKRIEAIA